MQYPISVKLTQEELCADMEKWLDWVDQTRGHIAIEDPDGEVRTYIIPYEEYASYIREEK